MNNIQQPSADDHIGTLVYHNVRDNVDQLAAALALAQAEMKPAKFDKVNPHFKAKYASLASIQAATIPALSKHGLSVTQFCKAGMIVNRLMHKSGQYIDSELPITGGTPQQLGSELTYKKRYLWSASCGISADDDDDANAAETKHDAKTGEVIENGTSPDELITPVQRDALIEIADEPGVDKAEFCKRYNIRWMPIAMVMRRLLTSYAMYFNRRYRRHGQLFQNRYKSILCEEDRYLKELVRYIHLNPLRAKVVDGLAAWRTYRFCGHGALMGQFECSWLDDRYVLKAFGPKLKEARIRYEQYVAKGVGEGRREDLTGGGLLRSVGGWEELKRQRTSGERIKGDERILGGSDFVLLVLEHADEEMSRQSKIRAQGWDFRALSNRIAEHFDVDVELVFTPTKDRTVSRARAILCYGL